MSQHQALEPFRPETLQVYDEQDVIQALRTGLWVGIGSMMILGLILALSFSLMITCATLYVWRLETRLLQTSVQSASAMVVITPIAQSIPTQSEPEPAPTAIDTPIQSDLRLELIHLQQELKKNNRVVVVTIEIHNVSAKPEPYPYYVSDFTLKDQTGTIYLPTIGSADLTDGLLIPNGIVQGQLRFFLPTDQIAQALIWQPDEPAQSQILYLE